MKRHIISAFFCYFLTACNTTTQFQAELKKATGECDVITKSAYPEDATIEEIIKGLVSPKRGDLGKITECVTEHDRPVWVQHAPQFIDIYDAFRAKVAALAEDYDNGDISYKKYLAEGRQEEVDFSYDVRSRRADIQADTQQTNDAIGSLGSAIGQLIQTRSR